MGAIVSKQAKDGFTRGRFLTSAITNSTALTPKNGSKNRSNNPIQTLPLIPYRRDRCGSVDWQVRLGEREADIGDVPISEPRQSGHLASGSCGLMAQISIDRESRALPSPPTP